MNTEKEKTNGPTFGSTSQDGDQNHEYCRQRQHYSNDSWAMARIVPATARSKAVAVVLQDSRQ